MIRFDYVSSGLGAAAIRVDHGPEGEVRERIKGALKSDSILVKLTS